EPGRFPQPRVHGDRGESGQRIDLIEHRALLRQEEVDACEPRALGDLEREPRGIAYGCELLVGHSGGQLQLDAGRPEVLRLEVVELPPGEHDLADDAARARRSTTTPAEHRYLDLPADHP